MVDSFFQTLNRTWNGLHEAALLLATFAFGAQLLGLIRDRMLAARFGAGEELDVYYAAFRIPDLLFITLASIVSVTVLIPFLSERLVSEGGKREARTFIDTMATALAATLALGAIFAAFLAPHLAVFIVPGFSPAAQEEWITLTRLLLLSPVLFGLSNLLGSITQTLHRFTVFALGPLLYNAGILLGVLVLAPSMGIRGAVVGALLGAFLHLAVQIPVVKRERLMPRITLAPDWNAIGEVFRVSLPRTIALAAGHIASTVLVALASTVAEGAIAVFALATNLQGVPLAVVGVSYSVAAFPTLARLHAKGDREAFMSEVATATRHILFWSVPATVLFIVLRAQITRTALGTGNFDWTATRLTAAGLALFALSVAAQSLVLLYTRGAYATGNTRMPLRINVLSSLGIIFLAYGLLAVMRSEDFFRYFIESLLRIEDIPGTAVVMLPLAFSLGMIMNALLLGRALARAFPGVFRGLRRSLLHVFTSSVLMGFVAYHALGILDDMFALDTLVGIFAQGAIAGSVGIVAHVFLLRILENPEIAEVGASFRRKFWKAKPIAPEQESVA